MKKLYTLLSVLAVSAFAGAQNLVPNGSFEAWTDGTPDGYTITIPANGGSVAQELGAGNIQEGSSSARFTAPAGTGNVRAAITDIPVTPGETYTFSYWYKDESDNARGRHWASWRAGTSQLTDNADILQPDYMPNTTGWQQVTHTLVAPATATAFRLDFRVYQQEAGADSGLIYYDNIVFGSNLGTSQNSIAGLSVYPNPVLNGNLYITSDSNMTKSVAIYDVLGKMVAKANVNSQAMNVSNLNKGVYIVKITEDGKTATRKLVIK